jgi:asparagine synthase (glutamine-hydrolysing)
MCGIAAALDWPDAEGAVQTLISGLLHRGDITDPLVSPFADAALCTRRLRIVDGKNAVQPQRSADGRILVSFNGEIYNHAALRLELKALGVRFVTLSDTEVLANALAVWGGKAISRLQGMFAFVAIDLKTKEFIAARDPFGQKPLYLIQSGTGFLFCSEIRPLLQAAETGEVLLLPPGYAIGRNFCTPFFTLPAPTVRGASDPKVLDAILSAAVARCVPPDLPFATLFSGGIDSTLIAHYAGRVKPAAPGYFLGGEDAPDYAYAARYADQSGLDLRTVPFDGGAQATFAAVGAVIEGVESFEPSVIRPSLCYHALSKAVQADGYRVVLVGEGADELYGGYAPLEATYGQGEAYGDPVREQCLSMLGRSALQRTDRCTMRFGIEARAPFLDLSVVDHAFSLDAAALTPRVNGAPRGKGALRALYDLYPEALPPLIRDRRKLPLNEGAGLDDSQIDSPMKRYFEDQISDRDFTEGRRRFDAYDLESKEALFYIQTLAATMDIERVPHLKGRLKLSAPAIPQIQALKAVMA